MSESAAAISHGLGATIEPSPYGMQSKKLTMWLFIASDAITFGAILFAYSYLRVGSANWSRPFCNCAAASTIAERAADLRPAWPQ